MVDVMQHEVPIAIGKRRFDSRLNVQPRAPSRVFLRHRRSAQVKRGPRPRIGYSAKIFVTPHMPAPVHVLQHSQLIDPKNIRNLASVENKDLGRHKKPNWRWRNGGAHRREQKQSHDKA